MQKPVIEPLIMKRLAFIQMLYQQGVEQSHLPEPLKAMSVLSLHDTSELFLVLASEKLGLSLHRMVPFMEYWKLLSPAKLTGGIALSGQQGMERLNDLRNGLKHRGTLPSAAAVDQACGDVRSFLEDNTLAVFGITFAEIDMAEVIPQPEIRDKVKAASARAQSGELVEAIRILAEAYKELFDDDGMQLHHELAGFGQTVGAHLSDGEIARVLWRPADQHGSIRRPAGGAGALASQIGKVTRAVQEMQQGLRVMALGIDYRQFSRFQQLTVYITDFMEGRSERDSVPGYAPTNDEFGFCRQFIITVALRMAELQAYAAEPSWWGAL